VYENEVADKLQTECHMFIMCGLQLDTCRKQINKAMVYFKAALTVSSSPDTCLWYVCGVFKIFITASQIPAPPFKQLIVTKALLFLL